MLGSGVLSCLRPRLVYHYEKLHIGSRIVQAEEPLLAPESEVLHLLQPLQGGLKAFRLDLLNQISYASVFMIMSIPVISKDKPEVEHCSCQAAEAVDGNRKTFR